MVHAIGFPAQLLETKALPDLPDLLVNRITIFGRPMDFVAKRARHAEPDEPDVLACDLDHARASKLDVVQIAFGGTLKNLQRLHAVDLVKILPEADVLAQIGRASCRERVCQYV